MVGMHSTLTAARSHRRTSSTDFPRSASLGPPSGRESLTPAVAAMACDDLALLTLQAGPKLEVLRLEDALHECENDLQDLEQRARSCADLRTHRCEEEAQSVRDSCLELSRRLEDLAADALECSCNRVPGAMDAFHQANNGLDRLATCLELCRQVAAHGGGQRRPDVSLERQTNSTTSLEDMPEQEDVGLHDFQEAENAREDATSAIAKAFAIATASTVQDA